eukprot:jgi/Mesen1/4201/ME000219S03325
MATTQSTDILNVDVYYDVGSPYSWLALEILFRYIERWQLRVQLHPVLVGALHKATGNSMPASVPARGRQLAVDLQRNARFMRVPLTGVPPGFGSPAFNTIKCQRLLTAVALRKGEMSQELRSLTRAIYSAIWGGPEGAAVDIMSPAFLERCCRDAPITEPETAALLAEMEGGKVKDRLKEVTAEAVRMGAYGVPTIVVTPGEGGGDGSTTTRGGFGPGESLLFFGSDRFEQMAFVLGKSWEGPIPTRTSKL